MSPDDHAPGQDYSNNPYAAPLSEDAERPFDPTLTGRTLNPWVSIWNQPRATIRQIVETDPRYMVLPIVMMMGVSTLLSGVVDSAAGPTGPNPLITPAIGIVASIVLGPVLGLLLWLLNSWLVSITARWIGGQATLTEMRAAYAWGSVPGIATAPFSLLLIMLAVQFPGTNMDGLIAINGLAEGVFGIWTFVVLCKCIGEVSLFSAWKGWGAMILGGLLMTAPMIVLAIIIFVVVLAL